MPTIYVTRQGQTVDGACLTHYGRTKEVSEAVLDANPGLADLGAILPTGTRITMPEIAANTAQRQLVSLWD